MTSHSTKLTMRAQARRLRKKAQHPKVAGKMPNLVASMKRTAGNLDKLADAMAPEARIKSTRPKRQPKP